MIVRLMFSEAGLCWHQEVEQAMALFTASSHANPSREGFGPGGAGKHPQLTLGEKAVSPRVLQFAARSIAVGREGMCPAIASCSGDAGTHGGAAHSKHGCHRTTVRGHSGHHILSVNKAGSSYNNISSIPKPRRFGGR